MSDHLTFKNRLLGLQSNLLNFAYQLTTNRDAAQDLVQDTTLKVLDNESKYVDNVNFKGWVFSITIVDQSEDLYHLNLSQESGLDTPEGSFAAKEISAAINGFAPEYKVPFTMYIAGYKYSEIAEKMDLPLGTVKSRIFFARKRLQTMLKDYR